MIQQTTSPESYLGQYFIARQPQMFRPNEPAVIEAVEFVRGRSCYRVHYPDGVLDHSPIENEDFVGTGGLGVFYDIVKEHP